MSDLAAFVRQFAGVRIAVLGDPMIDYYHFGHVDRLSPEAPVPVFIEDKVELRDGGAGNVAANLEGLGCEVIRMFPPAPHTIKHRYMVGGHQMFRHDRDHDYSARHAVLYSTRGETPSAYVISDYGKGWCTAQACQQLIEHAQGVPVIVDPKGRDWEKYKGATVICPNDKEYLEREAVLGWQPTILRKCGPKGLELRRHDVVSGLDVLDIFPARARHVFDVTGAGDTVVAVMAAALAIRCEMPIAAELANIAAGVVVGEVGTWPITSAALLDAVTQAETEDDYPPTQAAAIRDNGDPR